MSEMTARTITAQAQTTIQAPRGVVFRWLTDPGLLPQWVTGLVESRPEGAAKVLVGARSIEVVSLRGRSTEMPSEIVELQPDRVISSRIETPDGPLVSRFELEDVGGTCRVVQTLTAKFSGTRWVPSVLIAAATARQLRRDLATLSRMSSNRYTGGQTITTLHDVLPALLRAQVDMGGDLSTPTLAATTGMSPSRFHERFRRATGETVKRHTLRLRLERAAFRLLTERTGVSAIGFDLGFGYHEAFTRAFRRHFGMTPSRYRTQTLPVPARGEERPQLGAAAVGATVSTTSAVLLRPAHVAFVRRTGPYERVEPADFTRILEWATRRQLDPICLLGIAHDAPGITPDARLRFDVGVQVARPFPGTSAVGYQLLPERWCASTCYVGPFTGLADAYRSAFAAAYLLRGFQPLGLPVEEKYLATTLSTKDQIHTTQILMPLRSPR